MVKQVNIQTVDAEMERLERADTLSTREQFILAALTKLQAYQTQEPKFYDVYYTDPDGKRTFYSRVADKPEFVDPAEGYDYVPLIERPQ